MAKLPDAKKAKHDASNEEEHVNAEAKVIENNPVCLSRHSSMHRKMMQTIICMYIYMYLYIYVCVPL